MAEHRIRTLAALACAGLVGCASSRAAPLPKADPPQVAGALPGISLVSDVPGAEWRLPGGDLANTRFSTLDKINTTNVANLRVASTLQTGIPHGHEGSPLVVDSTMYVVTPFPNYLIAIDLTKPGGEVKWKFDPHPDPRAQGIACCDVVNRGASYADGKVIYSTLDDHVVAVDVESGKEAWRTKVGDINIGETTTNAAFVVKDKVLVGNSGGELGVRGWVTALDVATGRVAWKAYSTGPDSDVLIGKDFHAFYSKDQGKDLGAKTWPPDQWKLGGGTVWGWFSYDPELNLIFYGTGNPGSWNPDIRAGDNKWSCAVMARNPDTGDLKWAYQITKHDAWDYDEIMENIAVDMDWKGQKRKLLLHPARDGFMLVLDRATGELLSAQKFQPVNWAEGYDLKTGEAKEVPGKRPHQGYNVTHICPSSTGAKEVFPSAFSPRTGLLYIPAHNTCMDYEGIEVSYIAGTPYLGADVKMYPGDGGYHGELVAWDVAHEKPAWGLKEPNLPLQSGVLATAGDVVFYGTMDGWFRAVDARNGSQLWQFKTGSGIVGNPMTYLGPDGKQYVAVYSAVGGWMGANAFPDLSTDDTTAALGTMGALQGLKRYTAPGDMLYVFTL